MEGKEGEVMWQGEGNDGGGRERSDGGRGKDGWREGKRWREGGRSGVE